MNLLTRTSKNTINKLVFLLRRAQLAANACLQFFDLGRGEGVHEGGEFGFSLRFCRCSVSARIRNRAITCTNNPTSHQVSTSLQLTCALLLLVRLLLQLCPDCLSAG